MKIERTKNASRNIVFGIILRLHQTIFPFLIRTAMLYIMGAKYLGLNSLFSSVLQVLNLAELGVGSAMVYSMYRPIAEDDEQKICALMRMYKIYYRLIGVFIGIVGLIITPYVPHLIKGDVPPGINVYILYLLNLGSTVLTYWLFAYKNCLLTAHQRTDVNNKVTIVTYTIKYLFQFLALYLFHNYYIYLIIRLIVQAMTNIVNAICVTKMYPKYKAKGDLPIEEKKIINRRIRDLFTSKVGNIIVNSADTIVVSAFLGLTMLGIYENYYYIEKAIISIIAIVFSSCLAGIGNSLIVETKKKNYEDFKTFTFITAWIAGFCTICLLNMFQPFMEIWVGKKLMLEFQAVVFFGIYFLMYEYCQLLLIYKDAAGIWHQDRFRPLITEG